MCEIREVRLRRLTHEGVSTGNQNLRIRQHFPEVICQMSQITCTPQATQTLNEEILLPSEQRVDTHPSRNGWERAVLDEILLLALLLLFLLCFSLSPFSLFSTTAELEDAESPASSHDEEERGGKGAQRRNAARSEAVSGSSRWALVQSSCMSTSCFAASFASLRYSNVADCCSCGGVAITTVGDCLAVFSKAGWAGSSVPAYPLNVKSQSKSLPGAYGSGFPALMSSGRGFDTDCPIVLTASASPDTAAFIAVLDDC